MRTSKLFMTICTVSLLAGCSYVTSEELEKASKLCEENGGVKEYVLNQPVNFLENIRKVRCNNGATFYEQTIYMEDE